MDTPQNILAKTRFQKYRGLESFRTSPWDSKENLPIDYSRIIEFADYDRRRKRIYKERKDIEGVMVHMSNYIFICFPSFFNNFLNLALNIYRACICIHIHVYACMYFSQDVTYKFISSALVEKLSIHLLW